VGADQKLTSSAQLAHEDKPLLRGKLHLAAFVAMLIAGPLLILAGRDDVEIAALSIYAACLLLLFGVSAAFHRGRWSPTAARRWRRADHSTIFAAIAGTYTPIALICLHGIAQVAILAVAWVGAAVGVAVRQWFMDAPKWAVALPYVVVGWCAVGVVPQLGRALSWPGFGLLLAGGLSYTAGAVVYARQRPDPVPRVFGFHEVFHACTIIGAALEYAAIAAFALPRAH
jgi:hemolysin III